VTDPAVFAKSSTEVLKTTCQSIVVDMLSLGDMINIFAMISAISGIGYLTALCQDIVIIRLLNNVKLTLGSLVL
jgi:hypothetical protein